MPSEPPGTGELTCDYRSVDDPREMFRHLPFPFEGGVFPAQLGAVVSVEVLSGEQPAREVIHADDGSWMIGDSVNDPSRPGGAIATHIWHVIRRNSSIEQLADLPAGFAAFRDEPGEPWVIEPHVWPED